MNRMSPLMTRGLPAMLREAIRKRFGTDLADKSGVLIDWIVQELQARSKKRRDAALFKLAKVTGAIPTGSPNQTEHLVFDLVYRAGSRGTANQASGEPAWLEREILAMPENGTSEHQAEARYR